MQKQEEQRSSSGYRFVWIATVCAFVFIIGMEWTRHHMSKVKRDAKEQNTAVVRPAVAKPGNVPHLARDVKMATLPKVVNEDTNVVSNLKEQRFEIMERQTATLTEESEKKDEEAGPRSLALPRDRIKALEKKGAIIN